MKITLRLPETKAHTIAIGPLTKKESQVLKCLIAGMKNREIAKQFEISVRTVETHHAHILKKLSVKNTSQAVIWGYEAFKEIGEIINEA